MPNELQERVMNPTELYMGAISTSPDVSVLLPILLDVQRDMPHIKKDAKNPFYESRYASLPNVLDTCKARLNKEDVLVVQGSDEHGEWIVVSTALIHVPSGQWISTSFTSKVPSGDPQKVGAVTTYGRRYSLVMLLAIATGEEDDDANAVVAGQRDAATSERIDEQITDELLGHIRELKWTRGKVRAKARPFLGDDGVLDVEGFTATVSAALDKKLADAEGGSR